MAIILTNDQKVVNGQFIKVQNDKIKHVTEAKEYYALWTVDENSNEESCLLFTEGEINKASIIGGTLIKNLICGKIYTYGKNETYPKYIIKIVWTNGKEVVLQFSQSIIKSARKRAEANIEDIPKKSWFYDKIVEEVSKHFNQ